jgi:hypothetical protein
MRLATELIPTYASLLGPRLLSPFWIVLFYFSLILFGLGQQLAITHTVVSGLIAIRPNQFLEFESALTFVSCLFGLVLCFPFATGRNLDEFDEQKSVKLCKWRTMTKCQKCNLDKKELAK